MLMTLDKGGGKGLYHHPSEFLINHIYSNFKVITFESIVSHSQSSISQYTEQTAILDHTKASKHGKYAYFTQIHSACCGLIKLQ
jgi:hypothetical protein